MYHSAITIERALDKIFRNEYVLPAIQREFVWHPAQICKLFDSVMQGYPFGDFLFWRIHRDNTQDYRYYGFVQDYHQRDNPHCPRLGRPPKSDITAVLDGQQRLTAFNKGLRGSMAVKIPYCWWNHPDAFPKRFLALNLVASDERDEQGDRFDFAFLEESDMERNANRFWFRVSDVLGMESACLSEYLQEQDFPNGERKRAERTLTRLHEVVHITPTIAFYEEKNQDIEHVLNIFIRCNSGGTVLSYSDLLLSIATSQWKDKDARQEVHQLVDDLNRIGQGLQLTKDFVLKAGLMLTDISNVEFKVRNFTQSNMRTLEENWDKIRHSLIETVQVITGFGFNARNLGAASALLPIAYYICKIGTPDDFDSSTAYQRDRRLIRRWLTQSVLKASGIWGSGLDTLLTRVRATIRDAEGRGFPEEELRRTMARRGKSLEFSADEIEDLVDMKFGDRRAFALLSLLFRFIDFRHHHYHIDHVFPKSMFTKSSLRNAGIPAEDVERFMDRGDRMANLQLLEGTCNKEKQAKLPSEWIACQFRDRDEERQYCDKYLLGCVPGDMSEFLDFYEKRRARLRNRIVKLVNLV